jgi:hypothetical protein
MPCRTGSLRGRATSWRVLGFALVLPMLATKFHADHREDHAKR